MNNLIAIDDIKKVLSEKIFPSITLWNRLEARPRANNFDRALKAEVRDPLWMLTKQWQMGEFRGDDAGSPAFAKIQMARTELTKYQAQEYAVQSYENDVPLEAKVEQKKIPFHQAGEKVSTDIRLLMGRHWLKMISKGFPALKSDYLNQYTFDVPNPDDKNDATIIAHREAWQHMMAVSKRSMDGFAFYEYITDADPSHTASEAIATTADATLNELGLRFIEWYKRMFLQPDLEDNNAWDSSKMEYKFSVSAPGETVEKVMSADEYYHGHLDWYNLDIEPRKVELKRKPKSDPRLRETISFFPVPVSFDGMPDTRWWKFEDGRVNFGDIKPNTSEISKLLFMEFGLVYANDWFLVPFTVPAGTIATVKGLSVTNVFGEKLWIEAAGKGLDNDWKRWNMFSLNKKGNQNQSADTSLLILPTVQKIQEGKPLEEVVFIRDEVANMVWAIEKKIPLVTGTPKNGSEAAYELSNFYQKILDTEIGSGSIMPHNIEYKAAIRYQIMNAVPENWIPFIPVHVPGSTREIQLQRASMPRILKNDAAGNAKKIKPRTQLLRQGLDEAPVAAYYIHEDEVPRAGVRVYQSYQRARWYNGKVVTWYGSRKQTGRGEGHSGLAFDQILPTESK